MAKNTIFTNQVIQMMLWVLVVIILAVVIGFSLRVLYEYISRNAQNEVYRTLYERTLRKYSQTFSNMFRRNRMQQTPDPRYNQQIFTNNRNIAQSSVRPRIDTNCQNTSNLQSTNLKRKNRAAVIEKKYPFEINQSKLKRNPSPVSISPSFQQRDQFQIQQQKRQNGSPLNMRNLNNDFDDDFMTPSNEIRLRRNWEEDGKQIYRKREDSQFQSCVKYNESINNKENNNKGNRYIQQIDQGEENVPMGIKKPMGDQRTKRTMSEFLKEKLKRY